MFHDWKSFIQSLRYRVVFLHLDELPSYLPSNEYPSALYWIGKEYWGKGIATNALRGFLKHVTIRPLYARAGKEVRYWRNVV